MSKVWCQGMSHYKLLNLFIFLQILKEITSAHQNCIYLFSKKSNIVKY